MKKNTVLRNLIMSLRAAGPRIIHKAMGEVEDVIFQNSKGNSD